MLRHLSLALALLAAPVAAQGQNPNPSIGTTKIAVTARSVPVDGKIPNGNTLDVKVDVQIEDDNHSYVCNVCVTIEVADNAKTRREVAKEIADAIKPQIKACLDSHNLPSKPKDVDKFIRCAGATVIVKGTPPVGANTGTTEKPITTYEGQVDERVRTEVATSN